MGRRRGFFAQIQHGIVEAERAERRRQRETLARTRHAQRMHAAVSRESKRQAAADDADTERQHAEAEVEEYAARMAALTSIHRQATPFIDWHAAARATEPPLEQPATSAVDEAEAALASYKPGLFARIFRRESKQRAALQGALERRQAEWQESRQLALAEHASAVSEWRDDVALAQAILGADLAAYDRVLHETGCLAEVSDNGCTVNVQWLSSQVARAAVRAQESDVVPTEEKSVTARGRLSAKKLPASKVAEIYQDFICGAAVRVGRELTAVLPLRGAVIDVWTQLLNPATGHLEDAPVLSVYCPREKLDRVNFASVDASELVGSLLHVMRFTRGKGMAAVQPLDAAPIVADQ
jgi:hypothetical protein